MTPYYQDQSVTIYHGDFARVLPALNLTDAVTITDPPYGETSLKWDRWPVGWPAFLATFSKSMWCFGSFRMFTSQWAEFADWNSSQEIVWEKHNGSGSHADRFRRVHELIVHFYKRDSLWSSIYHQTPLEGKAVKRIIRRKKGPAHWDLIARNQRHEYGGQALTRSVIRVPSCHGYAQHPTQKPEAIVRPLIEYACPSGGLVIDPFMGSGTTLRVCKDSGRLSVGCELDESFCEVAAKRMQQEALAL